MAKRSRSHGEGPPGPTQRQLRVGEELRHALSDLFLRGDFRDPALQNLNAVTVGEVRVSPDLRNATAFVMPLGGHDVAAMVAALNRAAPFVRSQIARAVDLRHAPHIDFRADRSFDEAGRIDAILRRPDVAADLRDDKDEDGA